jgi:hypothetical protein
LFAAGRKSRPDGGLFGQLRRTGISGSAMTPGQFASLT